MINMKVPMNSEKASLNTRRALGQNRDAFAGFFISAVMLRSMRAPCSANGAVAAVTADDSRPCRP
ncbi:hypothetical protein Tdes44962_MAKER00393 [Teratosphaeria destructans]|uniref:Uncharacterized protein n=1 Tax=Teratosphaeria destructans TaxID=418781 RepID=A0A9W7SSE2_9PEZI|nr:hypothetical protein Tdes44962_MAKER00393 [Teratosphaeria destructans]